MIRRLAIVGLVAIATVVVAAGPAGAHPLGNFTINTSATFNVSSGALVLR